MNQKEKDIILHASGLSRGNSQYRNHYCCPAEDETLNLLVAQGYFTGPHKTAYLPHLEAFFFLTAEGIHEAWSLKKEMNNVEAD